MPTLLTHPAVPLAISTGLGQQIVSRRLLGVGVLLSILPDLDVIGFRLGVSYATELGHRGFSHSLLFAFVIALGCTMLYRTLRTTPLRAFLFLFIAMASHPLLDACTNGGLGVALLWPWSEQRFFSPYQVIQVSPINPARFLTQRGVTVLWSEVIWVWLPLLAIAVSWATARNLRNRSQRLRAEGEYS